MKILTTKNIIIFFLIFGFIFLIIWSIVKKQPLPTDPISIYIKKDCPYCTNIKDFIASNNLEEKFSIIFKDIGTNSQFANELTNQAQLCNIDTRKIGVPFLFDNGSCFLGKDEIITYFQKRL